MDYPYNCSFKVNEIFGEHEIKISLNSGLTVFVGANASGKTKTLKALRDHLKGIMSNNKVRYLSSNRIGAMEQYRSKTNQFSYTADQYNVGDQSAKQARHQIETA